jgi:hypothetical protein
MRKFGSDRERRRRRAAALYEFEMALRAEGEISDFVYDEEQDLFRFPEDGRFAFSKEWADVMLLEERGYFG